jgi:aminocarboxymuconate-semialdehyde decarboxylase
VEPKNYLGRFWVDSVVHDPAMLEYILKMVGAEKITFGSDYPFPLGDLSLGKFIEDMDLDQRTKEHIFHHATLAWLGLNKERFE